MKNKIIIFCLFIVIFFSSFFYAEEREKSSAFDVYLMGVKYFDISDNIAYRHNHIDSNEKISPLVGISFNFVEIEKFWGFSLKFDYSPLLFEDYDNNNSRIDIYSFIVNVETRITRGSYLYLGAGLSVFDYDIRGYLRGSTAYFSEKEYIYPLVCSFGFRQRLNRKISFLFECRYYFSVDDISIYDDYSYDDIYLDGLTNLGFSLMLGLSFSL